jgi:high-affinity Fe2+/Pb2+ permease
VCIVNGEANLRNNWTNYNFWTGLTLAVLSAFLIGGSVMLKKKALLRLANNGQTRAGGGSSLFKDVEKHKDVTLHHLRALSLF